MGSHLAVRAVGIESTDLHNAVRVLKLLCERGNVACNYLDERKDSVEKKFISKLRSIFERRKDVLFLGHLDAVD